MKQVILGVAQNYHRTILLPLVRSIQKSGYRGDTWLLISKGANSLDRWLRANGIRTLQVSNEPPYAEAFADVAKNFARELPGTAPHVRRYFMYQLFLASLGKDYDQILLTDTRDVMFQRDPFDFPQGNDQLFFVREDASMTIGTCPGNSTWMKASFGPSIFAEVKDLPITCCGTVFGTSAGIQAYLDRYLGLIVGRKLRELGADTAVHNFILYKEPLPGIRVFDNEDGPVLTLHWKPAETLRIGEDGFVRNDRGDVPNLLHQYDRHPNLVWLVDKKYCGFPFYATRRLRIALLNRLAGLRRTLGLARD